VLIAGNFAMAQSSGGGYTLRKSVIGAGADGQAAPHRLVGTAGQPSAGVAASGSYRLTGGFHQPVAGGRLFCNGFEDTAC
jgi:hypothetical protein